MRSFRMLIFVLALSLMAVACQRRQPPGRVMVLGLDGMDPQTIDLMLSEGKLPNFARIRLGGAYAKLRSSKPLLSPVVWTTIATGKTPDQHRIGHFVAVNEKTGEQLPVTSQLRRVKALWNILSEAGRRVGVVGYWATWPAETVNGSIVSDHTCYHFLFADAAKGAVDSIGLMYPPELQSQLAPLVRRPSDITAAELKPFVTVSSEEVGKPFDFHDDLSHFKWALATADTYEHIGLRLWKSEHPDFLMTYIEATDSTSHLFGHLFRADNLSGDLAAQQARYGHAVEAIYEYADRIVGDFLNVMDDRTTLVVLSDHGFELGAPQDDPTKTHDMRRVSEKFHREEGILYLYGNHVRAGLAIERARVLDVAPTVLALSGVSPPRDMPGRVLVEALDLPDPERSVASYESTSAAAPHPTGASDSRVDPAVMEHLRMLGYLGDTKSPKGERNLAAVLFEEKNYAGAVTAYEALIKDRPKDGALRASLAGALGALGRFDEALVQLDKAIEIEPFNPEAYHNRGVILEHRGDRPGAIKSYQEALRCNPQYEPSKRAIARLGGAPSNQPKNDSEKRASVLAVRAGDLARKGDYPGAMKALDEAEKIAPHYVLIFQYRSNVAYLMGDRPQAIAALRKALAIEPDNALFKNNLLHLEQEPSASGPPATAGP